MAKTYFIDIDGTIVKHLTNNDLDEKMSLSKNDPEILLDGVKEFWETFDKDDIIIITTSRKQCYKTLTKKIFEDHKLRYDVLLMGINTGPRILINDTTDILFNKAIAINIKRNTGFYFNTNVHLEDL